MQSPAHRCQPLVTSSCSLADKTRSVPQHTERCTHPMTPNGTTGDECQQRSSSIATGYSQTGKWSEVNRSMATHPQASVDKTKKAVNEREGCWDGGDDGRGSQHGDDGGRWRVPLSVPPVVQPPLASPAESQSLANSGRSFHTASLAAGLVRRRRRRGLHLSRCHSPLRHLCAGRVSLCPQY